jgi:hypothetical protein|eukprot:COSAG06_NODE_1079_length_10793_cov_2.779596_10_plen_70_part_00
MLVREPMLLSPVETSRVRGSGAVAGAGQRTGDTQVRETIAEHPPDAALIQPGGFFFSCTGGILSPAASP